MNPNLNSGSLELAAWISCLFFLVAGWNQVEKFLERRTGRSPRRETHSQSLSLAKVDPSVTETLCESRRCELSRETLRLDHELSGLRHDRREEVSELQQKINKVDREVGELRASIDLNHQQLTRIDAKLDRVIERHTS